MLTLQTTDRTNIDVIDFGNIRQGERAKRTVQVVNRGRTSERFSVWSVASRSGRGNAVFAIRSDADPDGPRKVLAPGLAIDICVEVVARKIGNIQECVNVQTRHGILRLTVKAHVVETEDDTDAYSEDELEDLRLLPTLPSVGHWDYNNRTFVLDEKKLVVQLDPSRSLQEILATRGKSFDASSITRRRGKESILRCV